MSVPELVIDREARYWFMFTAYVLIKFRYDAVTKYASARNFGIEVLVWICSRGNKFRSDLMKSTRLALLAASLCVLPSVGMANSFSTVTSVQYVQACILLNEGKMNTYEVTYKCSCVIDKIADVFTQEEYEYVSTGFRYKNLPGDRGGVFRDNEDVSQGIGLFTKTQIEAYDSCRIRR